MLKRRVEVKKQGQWTDTELMHLKQGDTFRLTDSVKDGVPQIEDGKTEYVASGDPFPCPPPEWNYGVKVV